MFNADLPSREALPTSAQLVRSTIAAAVAAVVILVAVVLPAEYAIDPTGIGRALGLTEMGEIKKQLAIEAEADRQRDRQPPATPSGGVDRRSGLLDALWHAVISPAAASDRRYLAQAVAAERKDETVVTLKPNEGVEYKMTMLRGAKVQYAWRVAGGKVNYDLHGTPKGGGKETSYRKGAGVESDSGVVTAAYDGSHGWFWRNRGARDVTITLQTSGAYSEIRRLN